MLQRVFFWLESAELEVTFHDQAVTLDECISAKHTTQQQFERALVHYRGLRHSTLVSEEQRKAGLEAFTN